MEEKKAYKIGLMPVILLMIDIICIIAVIIMGIVIHKQKLRIEKDGWIISEYENQKSSSENVGSNQKVENNTNVENAIINSNTSTNNSIKNEIVSESNTSDEVEYTAKIVENRPYIYDAGYSLTGVQTNSYSTNDGKKYSISDIVVPYINMVSNDASEINSEIESLYNGYINEFAICSQNQNSYIKTSYQTFITSNIYSILMTIERGQGNTTTEEYIAYNFDTISGTKLDYNQVCYIAGIENAADSILNAIDQLEDYNDYYFTVGRNTSQSAVDERNDEINVSKNEVYNYYQQDVLNNQLVYFLDNNLQLNILVKVVLPDGDGSYNKLMAVFR